jgi:endonuclease III
LVRAPGFGAVDNTIRDELILRVLHYQKESKAVHNRMEAVRGQYPQVEALTVLHGVGLYTAMVIVAGALAQGAGAAGFRR